MLTRTVAHVLMVMDPLNEIAAFPDIRRLLPNQKNDDVNLCAFTCSIWSLLWAFGHFSPHNHLFVKNKNPKNWFPSPCVPSALQMSKGGLCLVMHDQGNLLDLWFFPLDTDDFAIRDPRKWRSRGETSVIHFLSESELRAGPTAGRLGAEPQSSS